MSLTTISSQFFTHHILVFTCHWQYLQFTCASKLQVSTLHKSTATCCLVLPHSIHHISSPSFICSSLWCPQLTSPYLASTSICCSQNLPLKPCLPMQQEILYHPRLQWFMWLQDAYLQNKVLSKLFQPLKIHGITFENHIWAVGSAWLQKLVRVPMEACIPYTKSAPTSLL